MKIITTTTTIEMTAEELKANRTIAEGLTEILREMIFRIADGMERREAEEEAEGEVEENGEGEA